MKILVTYRAIHNMAGGVERMSNLIMNDMVRRGHKVELMTLDHADAISFYPLNSKIKWDKLGIGNPSERADFQTRIMRIFATRRIMKDFSPDVVLAFQEASFLTARLASIWLNIPVIAAERNSPSRFDFMSLSKRQLAYWSFSFAKFVTIQCASFKNHYPRRLHQIIRTIPNPIFPASLNETEKQNVILSVGRLEYQKNFESLITAFAKIADHFPEWSLVIAGEGQDRRKLEQLINTQKLENRVTLTGNLKDLTPYYKSASIFCLPSRWEGFPNALGEALAYGLPSIGYKDCDGVRDLIKNGKNGLLADGNGNSDTLAQSLKTVIEDKKLRDEMSKEAILSIKSYEPSTILGEWELLLKEAVSG